MEAVPHRLCDNDIDFGIEIAPQKHFNLVLQAIFFDDFSHHENTSLFAFVLEVDDAVDLFSSCPGSKDGVEAVHSFSDVQNSLASEVILVFHDHLVVDLVRDVVLDGGLQVADRQIVHLAQMGRILQVLHRFPHLNFVFLSLFFFFDLPIPPFLTVVLLA
jgi:hypothetical protein